MRLESHKRRAPSLNVSALVDVLFILIVFVTLAARFDQPRALDVDLPDASGAPSPGDAFRVEIGANGEIRIDGTPVDVAELATRLQDARAGHDALVIAADGRAALERATTVLDAGARAGFTEVSLATDKPR